MKNCQRLIPVMLLLFVFAGFLNAQEEKVNVLLVTNDSWGDGDSAVLDKMDSEGFDVLTAAAIDVDSSWADGMNLVYVSSTVSSADVAGKFKNVPVPVIIIEPYAQDDMGMTLDFDSLRHFQPIQREMIIRAEGHFLAAGLTGVVDAFDNLEIQSGQGIPGPDGVMIAEYVPLPSDSAISPIIYGAIYAYEKGAILADTTEAAERRYFAGWNDEGVANLNEDGWKLWQASIDWCLYKDQANAVKKDDPLPPQGFELAQNYPNPFNPSTVIAFSIPSFSLVRLTIYDVGGREVATLLNKRMEAGAHQLSFDGAALADGVYFYKLATELYSLTKKMTLLR
jgi:hypothetical protein